MKDGSLMKTNLLRFKIREAGKRSKHIIDNHEIQVEKYL